MSDDGSRVALDSADFWPEDTDEAEGLVLDWYVSEGSQVDDGDLLCEFQVEKIDVEVAAPTSGTVDEIVLEKDAELERGDTLAYLMPERESER
ncbi:lipoyl domain-containing protein [Natronorubrum thiooxidans]|uniref:Biotin-requiring enzyme n=1 Tax=Natronorubrum thiooxidans TaxID=308853 RepID=A0A1N7C023_9EURY|nr:lipoyl domain-containing protein [Natronorubrum thiooxidans]SIR56912.1 Biotin-requiring enzyme [Natronorubrum thiooxidans]